MIDSICAPYDTVFALDLHTGCSKEADYICSRIRLTKKNKQPVEALFAEYPIDWGDSMISIPPSAIL